MVKFSRSHLLASSAVAGLVIMQGAPAARAQNVGLAFLTDTGPVNAESDEVETTAAGDHAIFVAGAAGGAASTNAAATITSNAARTAGSRAAGIKVQGGTGDITIASQTIATTGNAARGIEVATTSGAIDITSGLVTTSGQAMQVPVVLPSGQQVFQLAGADGIRAETVGGAITIVSQEIRTTGSANTGIVATASGVGGAIDITSGLVRVPTGTGIDVIASNRDVSIVSDTIVSRDAIRATGRTVAIESNRIEATSPQGGLAGALILTAGERISVVSGEIIGQGNGLMYGINAQANNPNAPSIIEIDSGTIQAVGNGGYGILASAISGRIDIKSDSVSTTGTTRFVQAQGGVQQPRYAAGIWAATTAADIAIDSDRIRTSGEEAHGIIVESGEAVSSFSAVGGPGAGLTQIASRDIATTGNWARGIYVESGAGDVIVGSGKIATAGQGANGMNILTRGGDITITSEEVATTGDSSDGIRALARNGGKIVIDSTQVTTAGALARGIDAETRGGGSLTINSGIVRTSGAGVDLGGPIVYPDAIRARVQAGDIVINSSLIEGTGPLNNGIVATASERNGSSVTIVSDRIAVTGNGIAANAGEVSITSNELAARLGIDGQGRNVTIKSGSIVVNNQTGNAAAIQAAADQRVDIASREISAGTGAGSMLGIIAQTVTTSPTAEINIDSGKITARGDGAYGIWAFGSTGSINIVSDEIATTGGLRIAGGQPRYASGVWVSTRVADVAIDSGSVTTQGGEAHGIFVETGGGLQSLDLLAATGAGTTSITSRTASTAGAQARGIFVRGDRGDVTVSSGTVQTSGAGAYGIDVRTTTGSITIDSGSVTTSGSGEAMVGINAFTTARSGNITIDSRDVLVSSQSGGTDFIGARGIWANADGGGDITITAGRTEGLTRGIHTFSRGGTTTIVSQEAVARSGIALLGQGAFVNLTSGRAVATASPGLAAYSPQGTILAVGVANTGDPSAIRIVADTTIANGFGLSGISVAAPGEVSVTSNTITVNGGSARGIRIAAQRDIDITSGSITALGTGSDGIFLELAGGDVDITSGSIAAGRTGILGRAEGTLRVASGSITSGGRGIEVNSGADLFVTSSAITAQNDAIRALSGRDLGITVLGSTLSQATGIYGAAVGRTAIEVGAAATVSGTEGIVVLQGGNASLRNDGTIIGTATHGVRQISNHPEFLGGFFTVNNGADASITGAGSGIVIEGGSGIILTNAGTIRGNGIAMPNMPPEAGVRLQTGQNVIVNSGTISGAQLGIVSARVFNPFTQAIELRIGRTEVTNSGTIRGETSDGIALFAGGSIVNSGTIVGQGNPLANGISIQSVGDQAGALARIGEIENRAGGTITGERFGAVIVGGGSILNAGTITGREFGAVLFANDPVGKTGVIENSGTIDGGVAVNLQSVNIVNSGAITKAVGAAVDVPSGSVAMINSGTISGGNGLAMRFGSGDDLLTLRTGSRINGLIEAGGGFDRLVLEGTLGERSETQQLSAAEGFERLEVASGYWTTTGYVGTFGNVLIGAGSALEVSDVEFPGFGRVSAITTTRATNNGRLVLNWNNGGRVLPLDVLTIDGSGALELIGDGVFTVASDILTYTGGTTISGGGLILAGTLPGNVTTQGSGFFQLASGGSFNGNLVNNGRFILDGPDDLDFLGNFSGSGILDKLGAGVLTFRGAYAFRGTTNIFGGSVRIGGVIDPATQFNLGSGGVLDISGNDQTISGLSGEEEARVELGAQTLVISQQDTTVFAGSISGSGGIVKDGDGVLILSGNNTFTGNTAINGGTLAVTGSLASGATVEGGTLGGTGTIAGTVVIENGGTLSPGLSPGTLTLGSLVLNSGSTTVFELGEAGVAGGPRNDLIRVTAAAGAGATGNLALNGGAISVVRGAGFGAGRYTLIAFDGALTGSLGNLTLNPLGGGFVGNLALGNNSVLFNAAASGDLVWWNGATTNPTGAIVGGSGTWSLAGGNFTTSEGTVSGPWAGNGSLAVFGGRAGTVTIARGAVLSPMGLNFLSDGYVIAAGDAASGLALAGPTGIETPTGVGATIAAAITGSGSLTKTGAGTLTLTGANTFTGTTTILGGTLALGDGGASGSTGSGAIVNNSALAINRSNAFTLGNTVSGSGRLVQDGTGTTTLTGANSYSGGTQVNRGRLVGTTASLQGAIVNNAALEFAMATGGTFAGTLSGSGLVEKTGAGVLNFAGNGSGLTGPFAVLGGGLRLDGANGGRLDRAVVTLASGTRLTGSGLIGGLVVQSGAVVAPGNSLGRIDVAGNVAFLAGSRLSAEVSNLGADLIAASGTARLAGALDIVNITPTASYNFNRTFSLITAEGGLSGSFDAVSISGFSPIFRPTLRSGARGLDLVLAPNSLAALAGSGLTGNRAAVAARFDTAVAAGFNPQAFFDIYNLAPAPLAAALDQLAGEVHPAIGRAAMRQSRLPREAVLERAAGAARADNPQGNSWGGWGKLMRSWGDVTGEGAGRSGAAAQQTDTEGFVIGFDGGTANDARALRFGIYGSYLNTRIAIDGRGSSGRIEQAGGGVYASLAAGGFSLVAGGGAARFDVLTNRTVALPGLAGATSTASAGDMAQLFGRVGYRFDLGAASLEPYAAADAAWIALDQTTERGGAAALAVGRQEYRVAGASAGVAARLPLGKLRLESDLAARFELGDRAPQAPIALAAVPGQPTRIASTRLAGTAFTGRLGAVLPIARRIEVRVDYAGEFSATDTEHTAQAGLTIAF